MGISRQNSLKKFFGGKVIIKYGLAKTIHGHLSSYSTTSFIGSGSKSGDVDDNKVLEMKLPLWVKRIGYGVYVC